MNTNSPYWSLPTIFTVSFAGCAAVLAVAGRAVDLLKALPAGSWSLKKALWTVTATRMASSKWWPLLRG